MADQRDTEGNEDHAADDKGGKGIMARVNAPSDPETEGVETETNVKPTEATKPSGDAGDDEGGAAKEGDEDHLKENQKSSR